MQGTRTARPKITVVSGIKIGVMNVCSLGKKLNYVIDDAIKNELDLVELTDPLLSNVEKNNAIVVDACLDHRYTVLHRHCISQHKCTYNINNCNTPPFVSW